MDNSLASATEIAALLLLIGRPSIAPEKLLRAMLLQAIYGSEQELFPRHAKSRTRKGFNDIHILQGVW
ncbi:hypothetical protein GOE03_29540 [Sinorhizobium medicae]|nr:hypothetical protein [Sinorhizobium medicae]